MKRANRAVLDLARLLAADPRRPGPAPPTDDDCGTEDVLRACALATQDWYLMVRGTTGV